MVCQAKSALTQAEIKSLYEEAKHPEPDPAQVSEKMTERGEVEEEGVGDEQPEELTLIGSRSYNAEPGSAGWRRNIPWISLRQRSMF
ncbi:MAG: hypothetical protein U5P10_14940 [Spirochaetia bacterium]|nr:hypothetical protein [Spirochaetia bacterium]